MFVKMTMRKQLFAVESGGIQLTTGDLEPLSTLYATEECCSRALFAAKWPDGFRCPRCDHSHTYCITTRRLPLFECRACGAQTSLIAGTIIEGSRTPLHSWFQAIFLHARPEGINALQLSRFIGVTYKTAWLICHKIRHAMQCKESQEFLTGLVRITDATLFTRTMASSAWHNQEQSVLMGSSENEQGQIFRIKIKKQNKQPLRNRYESPPVEPFISEHVSAQATQQAIVTRHYFGNRNHALLGIVREAQWELARKFRGIGTKHLQVYLDQFCYVWNRRKQVIFDDVLGLCAQTRTITYTALIGNLAVGSNRLWTHTGLATKKAS
jgi:transposase-like protein